MIVSIHVYLRIRGLKAVNIRGGIGELMMIGYSKGYIRCNFMIRCKTYFQEWRSGIYKKWI